MSLVVVSQVSFRFGSLFCFLGFLWGFGRLGGFVFGPVSLVDFSLLEAWRISTATATESRGIDYFLDVSFLPRRIPTHQSETFSRGFDLF